MISSTNSSEQPVLKVLAYVTRTHQGRPQLLVFTHRDYLQAGLQVPAGTVEPGEAPEIAVVRETGEESGLEGLILFRKLGVFLYNNPEWQQLNERHVFHLLAPEHTAEHWQWIENDGGKSSGGYVFLFRWEDLDANIDLAGNQGDYLHLLDR